MLRPMAYRPWLAADLTGTAVVGWLSYLLELATIIGHGALRAPLLFRQHSTVRAVAIKQLYFTGVQAVPFTAVLGLLTAGSLLVQARIRVAGLGASDAFGQLLVVVLIRELGPLLMALVVLARSGTAIATELATMQVGQEIRGLHRAGIDPFTYLVVPRLAGVSLSVVCLTLLYIVFSLIAGMVLLNLIGTGTVDPGQFASLIAATLTPGDLVAFVAKTAMPGLLIAAIACREGFYAGTAITNVPRATTKGVVRGIIAVVVWNGLVTATAWLA
jgi:phospholipid/cholesterol/gamma-HCH transport system permease protein